MEAAGTALAEAVAGLAPQGPVRIVCGKGNNGGDGLVAARHLARDGLRGRGAGALAEGRAPRRPRCLAGRDAGCGRRRDLRHRLRRRAARAGRRRDRGDQPLRRAGGRLRHRLRGRRLERRGRGRCGRGRPDRQLPRRQARAPDRPRQVAHGRAAGRADRDPRRRARRAGGRHDRPGGAQPGAAPRAALDQVQLRPGRRSPAARAASPGAVRMSSLAAIRAGAGYATVAVPADLEPVFEAGPAGGDVGRLPGRRRLPRAGLGEGGPARLRARRGGRARSRAWVATPARSSWRAKSSRRSRRRW